MIRSGAALALAAALLIAGGEAAAAELKVLATGSMGAPLKTIAQAFEKNTGHKVDVTVGITTTVTATLEAGDMPDVIEVTSVGMDALEQKKFIRPGSRTEVAHAVIGLAVKNGAPAPDISTPDGVKRALRNAHGIAYVNPRVAAQVGVNLLAFLDKTGVAGDAKKKAKLALSGDEAVEMVAKGEADIAIAFVSEIRHIKGAQWLGPIPASLQVPTNYSMAIGAKSADPDLARQFLDAVRSPDGQRAIRDAGLEPVRGN